VHPHDQIGPSHNQCGPHPHDQLDPSLINAVQILLNYNSVLNLINPVGDAVHTLITCTYVHLTVIVLYFFPRFNNSDLAGFNLSRLATKYLKM
jgi:hypothetical protein